MRFALQNAYLAGGVLIKMRVIFGENLEQQNWFFEGGNVEMLKVADLGWDCENAGGKIIILKT